MGRPTKLTPALLAKLEPIADDGRGLLATCDHLDITDTTFRAWEALDPADPLVSSFLGLAVRVRARANVGRRDKYEGVIDAAMDDPDVRPAEKAALAMAWMRLHGTQVIELTGKDGGPLEFAAATARARLIDGADRLAIDRAAGSA